LVAYRAFSDIAGKGAFFLVTLFAARRLSQDAFGLFSLGTTVGWIAAVATDFGIQLHLARAVAQRPSDRARLLRAWLRVRLWTAATAIVAVAVGLAITSSSPAFSRPIVLFTIVYVVSGLVEFLHYFYRGLSRSDIESTLNLWQRVATLVLAGVVLWWWPDVTVLALGMAIPALATFAYSARLATRLAAPVEPFEPIEPIDRRSLSSVIPIGTGIVLSALYFRIDVFLVQAWQGTSAVALYNAVFRLVDALRLFPAAVLAVALPVLFRATSRHPLVKLSALLTSSAIGVALVLWLAAGRLIPFLYGANYAAAVPAFRVLLLSFPLMSLNYALTHQLIGWHGHRGYAVVCATALIFNVALNTRLIPAVGIVGAAWATLATEAVVTSGCLLALAWIARSTNLSYPSNRSNLSNSSNLSNPSNPSNPVIASPLVLS
jgi:O-antigen/teichoic acid export membrane protein